MFHHLMVEKPWFFHHLWRISHSIEGSPAISSKVKTMLEEHQASMPPQAPCEPHGHAMLWLQFPWIFVPFYPLMRFTLRHGKREFCTISLYVYNLYIYILCVCIYIYMYICTHILYIWLDYVAICTAMTWGRWRLRVSRSQTRRQKARTSRDLDMEISWDHL